MASVFSTQSSHIIPTSLEGFLYTQPRLHCFLAWHLEFQLTSVRCSKPSPRFKTAVSRVLEGQNPTLHGTYFSKLSCPPPSHLKKNYNLSNTIRKCVIGFWVSKSTGAPSSPSYFSPGEETRPQITQKHLTTRDGSLVASSLGHSIHPNPKFRELVLRADLVARHQGLEAKFCIYRWLGTLTSRQLSSFASLCPGLSRIKLAINSADLSQQEEQPPFPAQRGGRGVSQSGTSTLPSSLGRLGQFIHHLRFISQAGHMTWQKLGDQEVVVAQQTGPAPTVLSHAGFPRL